MAELKNPLGVISRGAFWCAAAWHKKSLFRHEVVGRGLVA